MPPGRGRCDVGRPPQPLEVEGGEAGEDEQPDHGVDQRAAGDLQKDQHDAKNDQGHQCPQADPSQHCQVAPGGVADRPEATDE